MRLSRGLVCVFACLRVNEDRGLLETLFATETNRLKHLLFFILRKLCPRDGFRKLKTLFQRPFHHSASVIGSKRATVIEKLFR